MNIPIVWLGINDRENMQQVINVEKIGRFEE
jgi:hypothetical protein